MLLTLPMVLELEEKKFNLEETLEELLPKLFPEEV